MEFPQSEQQAAALIEAKSEILKLRAQLRRTEEERDILKKAALLESSGSCSSGQKRLRRGLIWEKYCLPEV